MAAAVYNIVLEQGASWTKTIKISEADKKSKNLTGYTGKAQLRVTPNDTNPLLEISFVFLEPRTSGKITLSLTASQTATLVTSPVLYDVIITSSSGIVTRILQGTATVSPRITR